ncbi:DJ-1/PfpI family protein [Streptomyces roseoverticillatus]|uniref:DJ-1/PfpI family protein n=1 Tax=Streptomyces roseoverticillatus TaxID=66429 RepID=UPI001F25BF19|nr:DJ-1/PfpI family protein [Streptomyces roseoverticillatus]MCF3107057.1 DJ-1/PfpI family protein [Streptomyces roseoverticillatus]
MPRILITTGDAAEDLEVLYPYQRLLEEGYEVDIAAPTVKQLQFVVHDFVASFDTYTEKLGHSWPADVALANVHPSDYAAVVIPGGRAPEFLRLDPDFQRIIKWFFANNRPIAHICHAVTALTPLGVLKGRRTAAWPALRPDVQLAGGTFVDAEAVVDGNMVSARAWNDQPAWMRAFVELLRAEAPVKS